MTENHTIGLDLSLNSPGWCHVNHLTGRVRLYCLQQSVRKHGALVRRGEVQLDDQGLWTLQMFPFDKNTKRQTVTTRMAQHLKYMRQSLEHVPRTARIMCEGFSNNSRTNCILQLAEVQGAWKTALCEMGFVHDPHMVPPSTAKKAFTRSGASGKNSMYEEFQRRGCPDLLKVLETEDTEAKPVQDLVDAYGLACEWDRELELLREAANKRKRTKKRKREVDEAFPEFV